jgi:hypothetical protein
MALCLLFIVLSSQAGFSYASEYQKRLWLKWSKYSPLSEKTISHESFKVFLARYLKPQADGINLIDYYKVSTVDRKILKEYLKSLSNIKIEQYNRDEQLAYWLNFYNALVINLILEHLPINNMREITLSSPLLARGPWQANIVTIAETKLSLYDIKNRIVRPIWNDPRVLYALFDGTVASPSLFEKPFSKGSLDTDLNTITRRYVNSLRGVQIQDKEITVSSLYDWFEEDFGGRKQDVIWHITQYANPRLKAQLEKANTINNYVYNWHINAIYE